MMKACQVCGNEFKPRTKTQKTCSIACRGAALRVVKTFTCDQCGKEFQRRPFERRLYKHTYCSAACFQASTVGHVAYNIVEPEARTCPVCGTEFLVGGRGRRQRDTVFCSDACKFAGRFRRGKSASDLSPVDAAYLAGFIDGEGSIMLYMRRDVVAIRLTASNTVKAILDWIATTTGIGRVQHMRAESPVHAASYAWQANGDGAVSVLRQIRPYMRVKVAQADLAIATQERLRQPHLKADRAWQAEWRTQMQTLNRRGPALTSGG